jgi:hypothetical protein
MKNTVSINATVNNATANNVTLNITLNNEADMTKLIEALSTLTNVQVTKKRGRFHGQYDRENFYVISLYNVLAKYGIRINWDKGIRTAHLSGKLFTYFVEQLMNADSYAERLRIYDTFHVLGQANMFEEGRGLKKDIVMETYSRMRVTTYKPAREKAKADMIKYLVEFPLTNNFKPKFTDYVDDKIALDEVKAVKVTTPATETTTVA